MSRSCKPGRVADRASARGLRLVVGFAGLVICGLCGAQQQSSLYLLSLRQAPAAAGITSPPTQRSARLQTLAQGVHHARASQITQTQDRTIATLVNQLGRPLRVVQRTQWTSNVLVVALRDDEVAKVAAHPDVARVSPDFWLELATDTGPRLIGAEAVWRGDSPANTQLFATGFEWAEDWLQQRGAGAVIGVIDTGISFDHPAFEPLDAQGYQHLNPLGSGNYLGHCNPTDPGYQPGNLCNAKLIGGYDTVYPLCADASNHCGTPGSWVEEPEFADNEGHGSHVAGIAAGNAHDVDYLGVRYRTAGVAPRAALVMYDVCYRRAVGPGRCSGAAILAAIEKAVIDGAVDVLNYSISGSGSPWDDPVHMAFLNATNAGILVVAAAGNVGPTPGSVNNPAPWIITAAATTHDRLLYNATLDVAAGNGWPAWTAYALRANGPAFPTPFNAPMSASTANPRGCTASGGFAPNQFDAMLALIERGECTFLEKIANAASAGAVAVVIHNDSSLAPLTIQEGGTIPTLMIGRNDGQALRTRIGANGSQAAQVGLNNTAATYLREHADIMAGFSARGPANFAVIKPDLAAPGVAIFAPYTGPLSSYTFLSGTSMASPHTAGAVALLKSLAPARSPAALKSQLMSTAHFAGPLREDGNLAAGAHDLGSGRIQVDRAAAAGLVLLETGATFAAADPALGGDPRQLNLPSLADPDCATSCVWTRRLTSVLGVSAQWTLSLEGLPGQLQPASFSLAPGAQTTIQIVVDATALPSNGWSFGRLRATADAGVSPDLSFPVAVRVPPPRASLTPDPIVATAPVGSSVQTSAIVGNTGGGILVWSQVAQATANLLTQLSDGSGGTIAGLFSAEQPAPAGIYIADDWHAQRNASLRSLSVAGGMIGPGAATLPQLASAIDLIVYQSQASGGGEIPGGQPEAGAAGEIYRCTRTPTGAGSAGLSFSGLSDATVTFDFSAASGCPPPPALLASNRYWLSVFPTLPGTSTSRRWFVLRAGNGSGMPHKYVSPTGIGGSATQWADASSFGAQGFALTLTGDVQCGAPWMSATPASGALAAGATQAITLTLNAAGLSPGTHRADLCIQTNDPVAGALVVVVEFTVGP